MRGRAFFIILSYCGGKLFAQSGFSQKPFEHTIEVFDANGRPFANPAIDIAGPSFFMDEWKFATLLVFVDEKKLKSKSFVDIKQGFLLYNFFSAKGNGSVWPILLKSV